MQIRAALLGATLATSAFAQAADPLADVAWLAGCWAAAGGEAGSGEQWMAPAGGTMFGIGRTVRQQRTVAHEFMQIRVDADGRLAFVARPSGQREATFPAASVSATEVVFENPSHDFPQRVIYRRTGAETALGRIEGLRNGQPRAIDFPLRRERCPAPP
jgi:hypothetical protein